MVKITRIKNGPIDIGQKVELKTVKPTDVKIKSNSTQMKNSKPARVKPTHKDMLKKVKNKIKIRTSVTPMKTIPVIDKLIITFKKDKSVTRNVLSIKDVAQHKIEDILNFYGKNIILKYKYNGKEYTPFKLPFWGF